MNQSWNLPADHESVCRGGESSIQCDESDRQKRHRYTEVKLAVSAGIVDLDVSTLSAEGSLPQICRKSTA